MLLGLWVALACFSWPLRQSHRAMQPERPVVRVQDVLLDLLGEGRTMLARLLWFKMDLMHEQLDDFGIPVFQQKEVVPILRMVTYLDPYFEDAYDTLAYQLYKGFQQTEKAIELVEEGLKFSPESFELNWRRAFFAEKQQDWLTALKYSNLAYKLAREDMQLLATYRCLYRCAVHLNDARLGMQVVDLIRQRAPTPLYDEQYEKWRRQLEESQ